MSDVIGETIGWAVKQMWNGDKVRRAGWNGKGMHVELQRPDAHSKMTLPYVFMFTAQGDLVPWLCSQTDLLATDWEIAEFKEERKALIERLSWAEKRIDELEMLSRPIGKSQTNS